MQLMIDQLVPIVAGFFLTTVIGGALGFFFQQRTWNHQHRVQVAERERVRAVQIFEEVSRILDKRLYRMRLLNWALTSDPYADDLAKQRMAAYREVLIEWNDNINRNLALVQQYFGSTMRSRLDNAIGATFVGLGRTLESMWKSRSDVGESLPDPVQVNARLNSLAGLIYKYNLDMIRMIQSSQVGSLTSDSNLGED